MFCRVVPSLLCVLSSCCSSIRFLRFSSCICNIKGMPAACVRLQYPSRRFAVHPVLSINLSLCKLYTASCKQQDHLAKLAGWLCIALAQSASSAIWRFSNMQLTLRVYRSASSCSLLMSTVDPALEGLTLNLFSNSSSSFNLAFCNLSFSMAALSNAKCYTLAA